MKCGPDGRIWIAVEGHGVYCHDPATSEIKCVMQTRSPLRCLEVDRLAGTIWFSWSGGGLFYTDDGFSSVHPFLLEGEEKVYPEDIISCIHVSAYNKIYLGLEQNGVVELNRATATARSLGLSGGALFVREIVPYSAEEQW
ncbi:MAG: hybrid sensor histidine kinase/response regulator, partial [Bacteroidales bacterium]|nr:hybrid sensor histidine kinase/response regulator [Bacteroidales bacterium]